MKKCIYLLGILFYPTSAKAQPVPFVVPNPNSEGIINFAPLGNKLVFTAGTDLWITDGTVSGTQFLYHFYRPALANDSLACVPYGYKELNGKLYFIASDSTYGRELWMTDGTPGGTSMVKDINPGTANTFGKYFIFTYEWRRTLQLLNNKLYFMANDGIHGKEIWETDGTTAGTVLWMDLYPGTNSGAFDQNILISSGTGLFLRGYNQVSFSEFMHTDGNTQNLVNFQDTDTYYPVNPIAYGSVSVFTDSYYGDLCLVNTGDDSITRIMENTINTLDQAVLNGKLYFFAQSLTGGSTKLMETDGTPAGTHVIKDMLTGNTYLNNGIAQVLPQYFLTKFQNKLIFAAGTVGGAEGIELYESDGTTTGTQLLKDVLPGAGSSLPMHLTVLNGQLFFQAKDDTRFELWRSDGTAAGTVRVEMQDANSTQNFSVPASRQYITKNMVTAGNSLYFYANYDSALSFRIYKLDVFPTGIGAMEKISTIDIYPNPANGVVNIDVTGAGNVSIHSSTGSRVYNASLEKGSTVHITDVRAFAPGIYTITTTLKDGSKQYGKFVKL